MVKQIYEHLKTRKKYNTLQLKYDIKCEELEEKIIELNLERKMRKLEKEKYDKIIEDYLEKIKKLKEKKERGKKDGK